MGPGISVSETLTSSLSGPLLVNGFIVAVSADVRLCAALAESYPPQCGGELLRVEGLDLGSIAGLRSERATRWTETQVQLLGDVEGESLTVSKWSSG